MLQKLKIHGSPKLLSQNQTSKTDGFQIQQPGSSRDLDSPYKNALGQIKRISLNNDGEDDFLSPVKTLPKSFKMKRALKTRTSKRAAKKKTPNSILKLTKDNFKNIDINPNHLQMVLALSKSTFTLEYPERKKEIEEQDLPLFLSSQKIPKVTTFLENYGITSSKNYVPSEFPKDHLEEIKTRKNSKFRFITPVLYTRTKEERESLINFKVSLIISQKLYNIRIKSQRETEKINSAKLKKYSSANNRCWNLNCADNCGEYVSHSLILSPSKSTVGSLLKSWEQIPGRDKSPIKYLTQAQEEPVERHSLFSNKSIKSISETESINNTDTSNKTIGNGILQNQRTRFCSSPDLFESDDELLFFKSTLNVDEKSKESELSFIYTDNTNDKFTNVEYCKNKINTPCFELKSSNIIQKMGSTEYSEIDFFNKQCSTDQEINETTVETFSNTSFKPDVDCIDKKTTSLDISSKSQIYSKLIKECSFSNEDHINKITEEKLNCISSKPQNKIFTKSFVNQPSCISSSNKICFDSLRYSKKLYSSNELFKSDEEPNMVQEKLTVSKYFDKYQVEKIESKTLKSFSRSSSSSLSEINLFKEANKNEKFYDESYEEKLKSDSFDDLTQSPNEDNPSNTTIASRNCKKKHFQTVTTLEKSDQSSDRCSLTTNHSRMDSGNISFEYNHTKSLNITDYVMDTLNSQEDTSNIEEVVGQSQITCSQESIEIISDEELNYSSRFSAQCNSENIYDLDNFDVYIGADYEKEDLKKKYYKEKKRTQEVLDINKCQRVKIESPMKKKSNPIVDNKQFSTPEKVKPTVHQNSLQNYFNFKTPNNNVIIKTKDVTPMADFEMMNTPKIREELDKFGIKPLKRQRGIELLKYIYESTHPIVNIKEFGNTSNEKNEQRFFKRRKLGTVFNGSILDCINIVGSDLILSEKETDLLFERKMSKKMISCRIPLQIAWYNFLNSNPHLKKDILLYEPIQLEVVSSMLKDQSGCNFHIEELIHFLDKKCITFRTGQWQKSNKKQAKAKS